MILLTVNVFLLLSIRAKATIFWATPWKAVYWSILYNKTPIMASTQESSLFWIFVVIFAVTAIITLLGITGVIKTIKEKYLNTLFTALILEVIGAVILLFQQIYFKDDNGFSLQNITTRAGLVDKIPEGEDLDDYIVAQLKNSSRLPSLEALKDSLQKRLVTTENSLQEKEARLQKLESNLNQIDNRFYAKVTRLHDLIPTFGKTINLNWDYENGSKDKAYELLINIFGELGKIPDLKECYKDDLKTQIHYKGIQAVYIKYREDNDLPAFSDAGIYLDEADVIHFLQTYLKKNTSHLNQISPNSSQNE